MTAVWTLIPAHRPALDHLKGALDVMDGYHSRTLIVTNGPEPIQSEELPGVRVLHDPKAGINIYRWWNLGLDHIDDLDPDPHHVLVMNADARITAAGVARLSYYLERSPAVMAGPKRSFRNYLNTTPGPQGLEVRIPGFCFMLDSQAREVDPESDEEIPLRADERFLWWCGDDDLEWRARRIGGTLLVGGVKFLHLGSGIPRNHFADLARIDVLTFEQKWGVRPW